MPGPRRSLRATSTRSLRAATPESGPRSASKGSSRAGTTESGTREKTVKVVDLAEEWHDASAQPSLMAKVAATVHEEVVVQNSCRSLPFTLVFWLLFLITQIGHRQVRLQNSMQQALTNTMKASPVAITEDANATVTARRLRAASGGRARADAALTSATTALDGVADVDGIMQWLYSSLLPQIWEEGPDGRGTILDFNRVVGGVRLQQHRLSRVVCPGTAAVRSVYNLTCYDGEREAPTAEDMAAMPGLRASADGLHTFWLDLSSNFTAVQAQVQQLWNGAWFTSASQGIWVQCVMLNAQVSLIAYAEVEFFLDRVGRLSTYTKVFTLPTEVYGNDWLIWSGDVLLLALLFFLFMAEIIGLCSALRARSFKRYCNGVRMLNALILIFGASFSIFFGYLSSQLAILSEELARLPAPPPAAAGAAEWGARHAAMDAIYDEVARLSGLLRSCELATFWYTLVLLMKFFHAFEGNPRLAVINRTLRECAVDVAHFLVVFIVVFMTFSLSAYFLFGHQIKEWANVVVASNTAYRALMGDFDFASMYAIAPISSVVWFWLFMSLTFLVMLNMLLAIILDTYSEVKEASGDQETLFAQWQAYQNHLINTVRRRRGRSHSHDELVSLAVDRPDHFKSFDGDFAAGFGTEEEEEQEFGSRARTPPQTTQHPALAAEAAWQAPPRPVGHAWVAQPSVGVTLSELPPLKRSGTPPWFKDRKGQNG